MTEASPPLKGGSYIRNKDGTLKRVGGTEEARPVASRPAVIPAADTPASREPDISKKGK